MLKEERHFRFFVSWRVFFCREKGGNACLASFFFGPVWFGNERR
jgi:hypothetical protein